MKIATWNVNSIRVRLPRLLAWLERRRPDVVCLQETKVVDADFPAEPLRALGYECLIHGEPTYNGVAILSRGPCAEVERALPGEDAAASRRLLAATIDGLRIVNVYAPNGSEVGSPKFAAKLEWYGRLRAFLDGQTVGRGLVLCGDLNVAPEDRDVWDPEKLRGQILFSDEEKAALRQVTSWGLVDVVRHHRPEPGLYTWWDYRAGAFHRGWGLRIDHIFVTPDLVGRSASIEIDRDERKGEKPSDHVPVMLVLHDRP
jgi:exodeoxyribonuclease-3